MSFRHVSAVLSLLVILAAFAGCGGNTGPEYAVVRGTVTLDGTPVTGGNVTFYPDAGKGTKGPVSGAQIDSNGKYELMGPGGKPGAVVGFYKVTVACPEDPSQFSSPDGTTPASAEPCNIPQKYVDPTTSGLTFEVKSGENTFDIQLSSK